MIKKTVLILTSVCLFIGCSTFGPLKKPTLDSRRLYLEGHSGLAFEIKQAILDGKVIKGMTKDEVRSSWGDPQENWISENRKNYEFWYYKGTLLQTLAPNCTVTFDSGIVEEVYCGSWVEK